MSIMSNEEFVSVCKCKGKCRCVREPIRTPEQRKQAFIKWLEDRHTYGKCHLRVTGEGVESMYECSLILSKAREML